MYSYDSTNGTYIFNTSGELYDSVDDKTYNYAVIGNTIYYRTGYFTTDDNFQTYIKFGNAQDAYTLQS